MLPIMAVGMKMNALFQVQCFGGCIAWTSVWMPTKNQKTFLLRPILRDFCATAAVEYLELKVVGVALYSNLLESDCFEAGNSSKTVS